MISLNERVQKKSQKESKNDIVNLYLKQIDYILYKYPFQIDKIEVSQITDSGSKNNVNVEFDKNVFLKSLSQSSKKTRKDVLDLSNILDSIYEINNPIRHKLNQFKKNIKMHFLVTLVKIYCWFLMLSRNKSTKKEIRQSLISFFWHVLVQEADLSAFQ